MIFSNLKKLARGFIPGAKAKTVTNDVLELIINNGVIDIADYTVCLKANKKFTVTAEKKEYQLSSVIGDYLTMDKPGLWWYDGDQWRQLDPVTLKTLDEDYPTWRGHSSTDPLRYSIDGDILTIDPPPDTTLASGFHLYYGAKPPAMTLGTHYPFSGSTTEFTHLTKFDTSILKYTSWKITGEILNKKEEALIARKEYTEEREEKLILLNRRLDISAARDTKLQGPLIC